MQRNLPPETEQSLFCRRQVTFMVMGFCCSDHLPLKCIQYIAEAKNKQVFVTTQFLSHGDPSCDICGVKAFFQVSYEPK